MIAPTKRDECAGDNTGHMMRGMEAKSVTKSLGIVKTLRLIITRIS